METKNFITDAGSSIDHAKECLNELSNSISGYENSYREDQNLNSLNNKINKINDLLDILEKQFKFACCEYSILNIMYKFSGEIFLYIDCILFYVICQSFTRSFHTAKYIIIFILLYLVIYALLYVVMCQILLCLIFNNLKEAIEVHVLSEVSKIYVSSKRRDRDSNDSLLYALSKYKSNTPLQESEILKIIDSIDKKYDQSIEINNLYYEKVCHFPILLNSITLIALILKFIIDRIKMNFISFQ